MMSSVCPVSGQRGDACPASSSASSSADHPERAEERDEGAVAADSPLGTTLGMYERAWVSWAFQCHECPDQWGLMEPVSHLVLSPAPTLVHATCNLAYRRQNSCRKKNKNGNVLGVKALTHACTRTRNAGAHALIFPSTRGRGGG